MRPVLIAIILAAISFGDLDAQEARREGPSSTVRLTFLGDIMAHDVNFRMRDYRDIYEGLKDIFQRDDLTVANLEFPVDPTQPSTGYPAFNANLAYVTAAIASGIDAFSLANNHSFDGREEGIFQTLRSVAMLQAGADRPLLFSGIRGNRDAPFMPQSTIVGGVRVGFLAVTQFLNLPQGRDYVGVVNYEDRKSAERFLSFVREVSLSYDIFIVSFHGDREYVGEPSAGKREFFRRIAENGATIVYGHHPHVIQRYETVKGGGGDRLIMYSMGNFVSGMSFRLDPAEPSAISAASGESFLLSVEVRCEGGRASVVRLSPIPVANYRNERGEVVVRRMEQLIGDSAGISPAWRSYFTERFRRMADFLARGGPLDPRDAIGFSRLESVP